MKRSTVRLLVPIFSLTFIIVGTYIAVKIAKGYRPTKQGIEGTGLLAANSFPNGAEVYLNGKLTTATDDTLSLPPAQYDVTIKKEGYIPWDKKITVNQELVSQTNATLFRSVPGLTPLTLSGAGNINPSPDGQKIAFAVNDASNPAKNGLYILELASNSPFTTIKEPKLIARNIDSKNFASATLLWSPGSNQILAHFEATPKDVSNYLLGVDNLNDLSTMTDVTARLPIILMQWEEDLSSKETKEFTLLPNLLEEIATQSATNVYFSPDDKKVMYTSTQYQDLPINLLKTPPSTNTQPEVRHLQPGNLYVYDLIEDKNFLIGSMGPSSPSAAKVLLVPQTYQHISNSATNGASTPAQLVQPTYNLLTDLKSFYQTSINFKTHYSSLYIGTYQWYPDSNHLILTTSNKLNIVEYDSTNLVTVYAGPFTNSFTYPWPDGSKLIVTTNLNSSSELPYNLYAVDIR